MNSLNIKIFLWRDCDNSTIERWQIKIYNARCSAQIFGCRSRNITDSFRLLEYRYYSRWPTIPLEPVLPLPLRRFYSAHLSICRSRAQRIIFVLETASNNQTRYSLPSPASIGIPCQCFRPLSLPKLRTNKIRNSHRYSLALVCYPRDD